MIGAEPAPREPAPPERRAAGARRNHGRRRWGIAVAVALVVHGAAFFAWRVPAGGPERPPAAAPKVQWVGDGALIAEGSALGDQLNLFDSAPLFLPTPWNFATAEKELKSDRPPGEVFDLFAPRLTVSVEQTPADLVLVPSGVGTPAQAIRSFAWPYFESFGRVDRPLAPLPERLAMIEVRAMDTGELMLTATVARRAAPDAAGWGDWAPLEFLVSVEPALALGLPQLTRGSGFDEVDAFFREHVQRELLLDLRLPAGYYRVTVGP